MDSGNSCSLQSSSGGDEEYDSSFLNPSNPPQPPHHNHPSSLFDPLSNYLDPFSRTAPNTNSLLNLDIVWPRGTTDITALMGSSSSPSPSIQHISDPQNSIRPPFPLRHQSSMPLPLGAATGARASAPSDQTNVLVRNSKKRSRASRRAPTTVLTTDTSNFRAMVQEFTGIPAPPFASSASASTSPFPRSRFDLFNNASLMMKSGHLEPPPPTSPYQLLRPFAQKVHPPFSSSTSMVDIGRTTNTTTSTSTSTTNTNNNYQLLFELGLPNQNQNLLNMKNPNLTSQSLLDSTPPTQFPLGNIHSFFGAKSQGSLAIPSTNSQLKIGVLDEFGMNHGNVRTHVGGFPDIGTSAGLSLRSENENNTSMWSDGATGLNDGDQSHSRSFNGNFDNSRRVNSCKMNYSAGSSLDFNADKGSENNVSSRGEGMVESWICSSD